MHSRYCFNVFLFAVRLKYRDTLISALHATLLLPPSAFSEEFIPPVRLYVFYFMVTPKEQVEQIQH